MQLSNIVHTASAKAFSISLGQVLGKIFSISETLKLLNDLRCGLSVCENKEPCPESVYFTDKFANKALLVERTRLEYSRSAETLENKGVEHAIPFHPTTIPTTGLIIRLHFQIIIKVERIYAARVLAQHVISGLAHDILHIS